MSEKRPILLINAPFFQLYAASKGAMSYYFPLGIGYLAAFLEKHGYAVEMILESATVDVFQELRARLRTKSYLFVGLSSMTSAYPAAVKLAAEIKALSPETHVVLGGAHASAVGVRAFEDTPDFDSLCIGEGEFTVLELARALEAGETDLTAIAGLAWKNDHGSIEINKPRPFHSSIDDFPWPARHLADFESFSVGAHITAGGGNSATMITSRGCPFGCIFCSARLTVGKKYRFRSVDDTVAEIRWLRDTHNVRYIFFQDDTLTLVRKRIRALCERLEGENLGIEFGCLSRVDVFDQELAGLLRRAGCRMVVFGIESGDQETLHKIGKHISLESAKTAVDHCKEFGLQSYASFVVGFPFESRELIEKTIAFGKSLEAARLTFNPLVPFPGTPVFVDKEHYPQNVSGWSRFLTTGAPPFDITPGISATELKTIVDRAHLAYYFKPRRLASIIGEIRSVGELWAMLKASTVLFKALNPFK